MTEHFTFANGERIFELAERAGTEVLTYPMLTAIPMILHGFSTRHGGVSQGDFSTMNLSFSRGDDEAAVMENFRRMAKALGIRETDMVCSRQVHGTTVRVVTSADRGKGVTVPLDYEDADGLITNVPGLCLATFYADCVPLFLVDPVHRAIGLSHSGWRGTVGKIGQITLQSMHREYGTNPKDVIAAIGPSICQDCYEVDAEVIGKFQESFESSDWSQIYYKKENGRYQLDLWKANALVLQEAGVPIEQTAVTNLCTCCNSTLLFSHRASNGKRGNLGAFLAIR